MSGEIVPAGPVFEGELVDDQPDAIQPPPTHRVVTWWQRSRFVPTALKSRQALGYAAKDGVAWLVRSPYRFIRATFRGLVVAVRGWRGWVRVRDYREAAEQSEKLADKFAEIRGLTLFRWKVTGLVFAVSVVSLAILDLVYGHRVLWIAGVVGSVALAILGRQKDGSPGRKAALAGPRSLAWTMDPQILVDAFRDAKLIGKDESLRLVERAKHQGGGWAVTVDLPATRKAADVVKHREDLASALAVDEIQLRPHLVWGVAR